MKHIFVSSSLSRVLLIICVTLFSFSAHGQTATLVQSGSAQGLNLPSVSAAFPSGNTAGNLIIAFVRMDTTTQSVTIADSAGNSFVRAVTQAQSSDGHQIFIYYAKNIRAGSNTVTATFSAANAHSWLAIYEYQGLGTAVALDQTAHNTGKNKSPTTGNTTATTVANELLFAGAGLPYAYSGTATAGTGFVLQQQNTGSARAATENEMVSSTGGYAGTFNLSVNANWSAVIATFITAPAVASGSLPAATQNAAYSSTLAASGGKSPYTWSIIAGALPSGISLNSNTGAISGTATAIGSSSFTVRVSDANGNTGSKALNITVNPPPTITTNSLPLARLTLFYNATLQASGGTTPLTWSIISGSLPAGLTLNAATGAISGTPTTAGSSNFTVKVTDAYSTSSTQPLSIGVVGAYIDSLSPSFGAIGTSVTIAGTLFGSSQGTSTVAFNGVPATPTGWGVDTIMVPVPAGASSGPVVVTVNGIASNGFLFTLAPQIAGVNPTLGAAGSPVTINGSGFGSAQGGSRVTFNGVPAAITSWNDTSILATVPSSASTGMIVVTVGAASSNGVAFAVSPSISSISPASGVVGTVVTVLGSNFGSSRGAITFAGVNAVPTFWGPNRIVVPVPGGAVTGQVVVTAGGQSSNGVSFAVGTGSLTGIVSRASDSAPLAGALAEALQANAVKLSATTDANGSYTIGGLAPGAYDLRISAAGYGTVLQAGNQVTAGGSTTVNASLDSSGTIAGTVTRSDGVTPIAGATVSALVGGNAAGSATTDDGGHYSIGNLAAAAYQVQASASGYNGQSRSSVAVTAGNTTNTNFNLAPQTVITYQYDEMGRLVGVVDSQQGTASYTYDAAGNVSAIARFNPGQVSVIDFTPKRGPVGTTVTISGAGFSDTASQNTVTFNGISANVVSATTTQLVAAVPAGATTGIIRVTSPNGSAGSGVSFTVTADTGVPTITGFTPTIGNVGTAVTIAGTNFASAPSDKVKFNISLAMVSAATATSISTSVPAGTGSGRISVTTPMGKGVSNDDFFIPPSSYTPANVAFTGRMAWGTAFTGNIPVAGQIGLVVFDATAGQNASLQISGSTLASAMVSINQPNGSTVASVNIGTGSSYLDSTVLPVTGTYTVLVVSTNSSVGSLTLNLTADVAGPIVPGTPLNATTTAAGQNARYTFSGTAGQQVSVNLSNSTYSGCYSVTVSILNPDGSALGSTGICNGTSGFLDSLTLPSNATYTVLVNPQGASTGNITVLLNSFADVTGTITAGTPLMATTATPGQNVKYTFSGTAGQQVSVNLSNSSYPCWGLNQRILKPDGSTLGSSGTCTTGFIDSMTLPVSGTYTVVIDPSGANVGSVTVLLSMYNDITGTITAGTPLSVTTTIAGQNALYTFSGTAGQQASLNLSNSTYPCWGLNQRILKPDGSTLGSSGTCTTGFIDSMTLPVSGTYTVVIDPSGANVGSVTVLLSMYNDITGTITAGTPLSVTTTIAGQNALYTFSGTAGQQASLNLSNSTYPCWGLNQRILKPDGSTLGSSGTCTTGFIDSMTLPVSGTYTVVIDPSGANVGSVTVLLSVYNDITGTIVAGTPLSVTTTIAGQNALYTFSGTAGQQASLTLTNNTYPCWGLNQRILKPDGSTLVSSGTCTTGFIDSTTLPVSGTYTVVIDPSGANVGSVAVLLSVYNDITGTIAPGTPVNLTTVYPGQNARYTFPGTTGDQVSVNLSNSTYTGCGSVAFAVLKPDGSQLGRVDICNNTSGFLNSMTLPVTGSYTVLVDPDGSNTGSATVLLNSSADIVGTITPGTPLNMSTTVAGQNARYTFSGTAGQQASITLTNSTYPGCGSVAIALLKSDGTQLGRVDICNNTSGFLDAMTLPASDTYTVLIDPDGANVGSATVLLNVFTDVAGTIASGTPLNVTTTIAGQNARYTFSGTTGQQVSVSISNSNYPGCASLAASLLKPDGNTLASITMCGATGFVDSQVLPVDGTYTVFINPQGTGTGVATVTLNSYADVPGIITAGTPLPVTIGTPGQKASVTFSGTQGQRISLNLSAVTISNSTVSVKNPGTLVAGQQYPIKMEYFQGGGGAQAQLFWSSPSTTQQIIPQSQLYPPGSSTADGLQGDYFGDTTLSGKPVATRIDPTINFGWTTLPDPSLSTSLFGTRWTGKVQALYSENYTFCTVTDDGVKLWINNVLVINQWRTQGGTQWCSDTLASAGIGTSGGFIDTITLPLTGTYTIVIDPQGSATGSMTLTLNNVPPDVGATLTPGAAPVSTTISTPGQNAQLTFAGAAGQRVSLRVTGVTVPTSNLTVQNTAPLIAGQTYPVEMDYFQGGGGAVAQLNWSSPSTVKQIIPQGSLYPPGSSASGGLNGDYFTNTSLAGAPALTRTDPTVNFNWSSVSPDPSVPSSNYSVRWTGGIQPAYSEPYRICTSTDDGARLWTNGSLVVNHWGSQGTTEWCNDTLASVSFGTSGIFIDAFTLPGTGTYQVAVDPQGAGTGSITYTLYDVPPDIAGTIVPGTPQTVTTIAPGQNATLTFAGTSGQSVSLQISGSTYTGCTALVFSILNPDRTTLASGSTCSATGAISSHTLTATGTYTVLIDPQGPATGSATVSLNSP